MMTSALKIVSRRVVSGGAAGCVRTATGVSAMPSTDLPQEQIVDGGIARRPHAGHTRAMIEPGAAIYRKILT